MKRFNHILAKTMIAFCTPISAISISACSGEAKFLTHFKKDIFLGMYSMHNDSRSYDHYLYYTYLKQEKKLSLFGYGTETKHDIICNEDYLISYRYSLSFKYGDLANGSFTASSDTKYIINSDKNSSHNYVFGDLYYQDVNDVIYAKEISIDDANYQSIVTAPTEAETVLQDVYYAMWKNFCDKLDTYNISHSEVVTGK